MKITPILCVGICLMAWVAEGAAFKSYKVEAMELNALLQSVSSGAGKYVPAMFNDGEMYGFQAEETVKVFLNEMKEGGQVRDLKIMWDDYDGSSRYRAHQGLDEISKILPVLLDRYVPEMKPIIFEAFFSEQSQSFETDTYLIGFECKPLRVLKQRLLIVTLK